jgi:hypothetical protein
MLWTLARRAPWTSYGRVGEDGAPADPDTYDYTRSARDALHFAALFDRFIQNLRRYVGYDGLAGGGHPSFLHEARQVL